VLGDLSRAAVKDLKQFIAYAKAEHGKLAYGSPATARKGT